MPGKYKSFASGHAVFMNILRCYNNQTVASWKQLIMNKIIRKMVEILRPGGKEKKNNFCQELIIVTGSQVHYAMSHNSVSYNSDQATTLDQLKTQATTEL